jgi:cation transport regulator ChaC
VAASLIWIWGYGSGVFSPAFAVLATVLAGGATVASYVRLICVLMTAPKPKEGQSR